MALQVHPALQTGSVKVFKEDKGYGFIRSNDGDVFFHIEDGRIPVVRALEINGYVADIVLARCAPGDLPVKEGNEVCFFLDSTTRPNKRPRATPWTLSRLWKEVEAAYVEPTFLVIRHLTVVHKGAWVDQPPETFFRGTIDKLNEAHPKGRDDQLLKTATPKRKTRYSFAVLTDGKFKPCDDPRLRPRYVSKRA